uniref:Uncharacterized protein n=1 Tax=Oryza meridionalis TaxID=40149 RepID=A0A0E0CCU0_9ORYZ
MWARMHSIVVFLLPTPNADQRRCIHNQQCPLWWLPRGSACRWLSYLPSTPPLLPLAIAPTPRPHPSTSSPSSSPRSHLPSSATSSLMPTFTSSDSAAETSSSPSSAQLCPCRSSAASPCAPAYHLSSSKDEPLQAWCIHHINLTAVRQTYKMQRLRLGTSRKARSLSSMTTQESIISRRGRRHNERGPGAWRGRGVSLQCEVGIDEHRGKR